MQSSKVNIHLEFWTLAEKNYLTPLLLGQITNAPIKTLLSWLKCENTPETALNDLKKYLNNENTSSF